MHYVYSLDGIMAALELNSKDQVKRRKQSAIKEGYVPSKIMGGIEYFDYDQMEKEGEPPMKKEEYKGVMNKNRHLQLLLF